MGAALWCPTGPNELGEGNAGGLKALATLDGPCQAPVGVVTQLSHIRR